MECFLEMYDCNCVRLSILFRPSQNFSECLDTLFYIPSTSQYLLSWASCYWRNSNRKLQIIRAPYCESIKCKWMVLAVRKWRIFIPIFSGNIRNSYQITTMYNNFPMIYFHFGRNVGYLVSFQIEPSRESIYWMNKDSW